MDVGEPFLGDDVARFIEHTRGVPAVSQVQSYGPCFRAHEAGRRSPLFHSYCFGVFAVVCSLARSVVIKASTSDSAPFLRIQMSLLDSLVLRSTT